VTDTNSLNFSELWCLQDKSAATVSIGTERTMKDPQKQIKERGTGVVLFTMPSVQNVASVRSKVRTRLSIMWKEAGLAFTL